MTILLLSNFRTSLRTASFLSLNNPKRALMLPVSKFPTKPKIYQRSQSQSTQSGELFIFIAITDTLFFSLIFNYVV